MRARGPSPVCPCSYTKTKASNGNLLRCEAPVPSEIWKDWPSAFDPGIIRPVHGPKHLAEGRPAEQCRKGRKGSGISAAKDAMPTDMATASAASRPRGTKNRWAVDEASAPQASGGFGRGLNNRYSMLPRSLGHPANLSSPSRKKKGGLNCTMHKPRSRGM